MTRIPMPSAPRRSGMNARVLGDMAVPADTVPERASPRPASPVLRGPLSLPASGPRIGAAKAARLPAAAPELAPRRDTGMWTDPGALLQVAAALIYIAQAAVIARAIDAIGTGGGLAPMLGPALLVLSLGVVRAAMDALGSRMCYASARLALSHLRQTVSRALAGRSPLDAGRLSAGLAASAMAEQAEAVVPYLWRFRPARLRATVVPLVIFAAVLTFSWAAALVLMVALPLIPVFMALIGWRAQAASEAQLVEVGGMNGFLLDRLRGLATIRALGAVDATATRLRASAEALRARTMAVLRIAFLSSAVLELFSALGVALVAVYVGFHLLGTLDFGTWGGRLTLGEGLFILMLAPAFFEPMRDLSAVWHDKAAGTAALATLERLCVAGLPLPGARGTVCEPASAGPAPEVRLEGVSFRHPGGGAVLADLDLTVHAGERVALLGPSGVGKSTLLALLAGLAPASAGRVRIDGTVMSEATTADLRAGMAWIGQRPHFFAASLRANIALGRPWIAMEAADEALNFAVLEHVSGALRGAAIGEGGAGLSGGEALRLAVARAAVDPRATLILADEPTAHLDATTAAEITEALLTLAIGRTLIVATHDPVLASRMDRVIRLEGLPHA
ncbi:thiol reductant ABC exporter subunit CydD [Azorhizobium sp. AG788]|uniref:thiol reductant ABC exporter subunit CydD n=1 Tax=Azorhizobium sp. AG788 TaxID=2183897 RepID=UPI003139B575